ncbi:DUF3616 domain-containing protein [Phormidium tenue FACHB-886]|nr:DUF3616 domain-containing protein [Phormidium tenue FACHB-886]
MRKIKLTAREEIQHKKICDSSAATALGEQHFVVANDEDNVLRVYEANRSGYPVIEISINDYFDNNPEGNEVDIEGTAQVGDIIYWITSHGRNKNGKFRRERHQFFANKLTNFEGMTFEQEGRSYTQLVLKDMLNDKRLQKFELEAAEKLPPKEGGLNIEGLTATPNKELLIGFRSPIPQGKALLLPLKNPANLVNEEGTSAIFGEPITLDLQGLGIRSIEYWESKNQYIIVAGASDSSDEFALYQWSGLDANPQLIEEIALPEGFRPEGVLFYPNRDNQLQLLSDDGLLKRNGDIACKELKDENHSEKYFRSLWVEISEFE